MIWLIGIISACGIVSGIYSFSKRSKARGIVKLTIAVSCPIIAILFGFLQDDRAFGGTKLQFFVHSATVDGDIWPWIMVILLVTEIVFIVRTACMLTKEKK